MNGPRTILDCSMRKLPKSRKSYNVRLVVPDNGIPVIEYRHVGSFVTPKKPIKTIQFVDLLFADKRHDSNEKWAFSIYSIDKTITFLPQDETVMNEWLTKIRELHSNLYPEFKRYDSIFEANLLDRGLARTMHIQGNYRLALCKDSLDLIPLITQHDQLQHQQTFKTPTSATTAAAASTPIIAHNHSNNNNHHHPPHHHHEPHHPPFETHLNKGILAFDHSPTATPTTTLSGLLTKSHHHHHHPALHHQHLPQHLPSNQRFCKRHPLLASRTMELVLRSIRRCGHTDSNFYVELGRHSQIGEGDLWMALNKKSTARNLHELLLATMKLASTDDQFLYKPPRSRSGSSSDNAHRSSQSRSSSLMCLAAEISAASQNQLHNQASIMPSPMLAGSTATAANATTAYFNNDSTNGTAPLSTSSGSVGTTNSNNTNSNSQNMNNNHATNNILSNLFGSQAVNDLASELKRAAASTISTSPMFLNHDKKIEEDSGYLPMA